MNLKTFLSVLWLLVFDAELMLSLCYAGSHVQVEVLCGMLSLADTPEETLPKLCSCLLALSPELSYSAASAVIKSLLLGKVISMRLMSIQTDTGWLFVYFPNLFVST